jgi:hypothetical protein
MQVSNHSAAASRLLSKTWIYSGTTEELEQFMTQNLGIPV